MNKPAMQLAVVNGDTLVQTAQWPMHVSDAAPAVRAEPGSYYVLRDAQSGQAPENVYLTRTGADLHIGVAHPDVAGPAFVIEGFAQAGGMLASPAQDGRYLAYDLTTPASQHASSADITNAAEPTVVSVALGQHDVSAILAAPLAPWWTPNDRATDTHTVTPDADRFVTHNATPTFQDTGKAAGNVVQVWVDGVKVYETTLDGDLHWAYTAKLDGGNHDVRWVERDTQGQAVSDIAFGLVIDASAASRPIIDHIVDNVSPVVGVVNRDEATNDDRPVIQGRASIGSIVYLYDNGSTEPIGSVTIGESGTWSFQVPDALSEGTHRFTATATDAQGRISQPSHAYSVVIDLTPPGKPVIENLIDDVGPITGPITEHGETDDTKPTLHGRAEPGSTITIRDGDTVLGSTRTDPEGRWSFTPDIALNNGSHALSAIAHDAAGNLSEPSEAFEFVVVTPYPDAPTIERVMDDVAPQTGLVSRGGHTNDTMPALEGRAEAGTIVTIRDGDTVLGSTTADADGVWHFTPTQALPDGIHTFVATAANDAGSSPPSRAYPIDVDTVAPDAPAITALHDDVGARQGELLPADTTDDARPRMTGTAEPNATVTIYDTIGGQPVWLGNASADWRGQLTFTPTRDLGDGPHAISAVARDAAGNIGESSEPFLVTVDTAPLARPQITGMFDNVGDVTGMIGSGSVTDDTRPDIMGHAQPGLGVVIYEIVNGQQIVIGETVSDANGQWSYTPTRDLTNGPHEVIAVTYDNATGKTSEPSEPFAVTIDGTSTRAPSILEVIDNVGETRGPIQQNDTTDDSAPLIKGTASQHALVEIRDTLMGVSVVLGSVRADADADADGNWAFRPSRPIAPLPDGEHSLSASAIDADGHAIDTNAPFEFSVISGGVPRVAAITGIYDAVEPNAGNVGEAGATNDAHATVMGTAPHGSVVRILLDGKEADRVAPDESGRWWYRPETALSDGAHAYTAVLVAPDGTTSPITGEYRLIVDTTAPEASTSEVLTDNVGAHTGSITSGMETDDATPTYRGRAEPGGVVTIHDGDTVIGSVRAGSDGSWTFHPPTLANGPHQFWTTVADAAGNVGEASTPIDFVVQTLGPGGPGAPINQVPILLEQVIDTSSHPPESIQPGQTIRDDHPMVTGKATPGSLVLVFVNGATAATTHADAHGQWSVVLPKPLSNGRNSISATSVDNRLHEEFSDFIPFIIDTTLPATSHDTAGTGDTHAPLDPAPHTDTPAPSNHEFVLQHNYTSSRPIAAHAEINVTTPYYRGHTQPGALVTIYDGATPIGSVHAKADGSWQYRVAEPMKDGAHSLSSRVTDAAGNTSERSTPIEFTVATSIPGNPHDGEPISAVTISIDQVMAHSPAAADPAHALQPLEPTNDRQPDITGHAWSGSIVYVSVDGGKPVASVQAGADGAWSLTLPDALADGLHTVTAYAARDGMRTEDSSAFSLRVDTAPPALTFDAVLDDVGGRQGTVAANSSTNDTTPTLTGTSEPGALLTIVDIDGDGNRTVLGSTTAAANGEWRFTSTDRLADGEHTFAVQAQDAAGNTTLSSAYTVEIDTVPPDAPLITHLFDDVGTITGDFIASGVTDDTKPQIVGRAEPDSLLTLYARFEGRTITLGSVLATSTGDWAIAPDTDLVDGNYSLVAIATDPAGNVGDPSASVDFVVDTVAPDKPSIDVVLDDVGTVTGPIANPGITDDAMPTLQGRAEAGSIVTIRDGQHVLGSTLADEDGRWTYTPTQALPDGRHALNVVAQDAAGNTSVPSELYTVTVDTGAVRPPLILEVIDNVGTVQGALQPGDTTDDAAPVVKGTAGRYAIVEIHDVVMGIDVVLGSVRADSDGNWTFQAQRPVAPLPDGDHRISASAISADGEPTGSSAAFPLTVVVGGVSQAAAITGIYDTVEPRVGNVGEAGVTNDARPIVMGTAPHDGIVHIYRDGQEVGTVRADANGRWQYRADEALADGQHAYTAAAERPGGGIGPRTGDTTLIVDTVRPLASTAEMLIDDVGATTGQIADGAVIDDATPTYRGQAEPGAIVTIRDGGTVLGSVRVAANGAWSFHPPTLADGLHRFSATVTDAAGNTSEPGPSHAFTVNTSAPADGPAVSLVAISIDQVLGHRGAPQQPLVGQQQQIADPHPEIVGKASPNSMVTLYADGHAIATIRASATGQWSIVVPDALRDGAHQFTASSTVDGQAPVTTSGMREIVIDTVAPAASSHETLTDHSRNLSSNIRPGRTSWDSSPVFSGIAEAGSLVTIYDRDKVIGSVKANAAGSWSFRPTEPLADGGHMLSSVVTDAAGNQSAHSTPFPVTISSMLAYTSLDRIEGDTGSLQPGDSTHDKQPILSGRTAASGMVTLYVNGKWAGAVAADSHGNWSIKPAWPLGEGTHSFQITGPGRRGWGKVTLGSFNLTVDTIAPPAPTFEARDVVGSTTGTIHTGDTTDDAAPYLRGSAEPGAVITVYDGDTVIGSVTASSWGNWWFRSQTPLADGEHRLSATATDDAGNTSARSAVSRFTIATMGSLSQSHIIPIAIDQVVEHSATDPEHAQRLQPQQPTNDRQPKITGHAWPDSIVYLSVDGGTPVASVLAGHDGTWSLTLPEALADGMHEITAYAVLDDQRSTTTAPFQVFVDGTMTALTIDAAFDDVGGAQGRIASGGYTDDTTPTLSGRAEAGSVLMIYDDDARGHRTLVGSVVASEAGTWRWTSTDRLVDGRHDFIVEGHDPAGNGLVTGRYTVNVDTVPPNAPVIAHLLDDVGSVIGDFIGSGVTDDTMPQFLGQAEPHSSVTLYADFEGDTIVIGTAVTDAQGEWSIVPTTDLDAGQYRITAVATDRAGNAGSPSEPVSFTVDTGLPRIPLIADVVDGVGDVTGPLAHDGSGVTDDTMPTISGTAAPRNTIYLYDDTGNGPIRIGSTTSDAAGNWQFVPSTELREGEHNLSARAHNASGLPSDPSREFHFVVQLDGGTPVEPPPVPSHDPEITSVSDHVGPKQGKLEPWDTTDDRRPVVEGSASAGATVYLYDQSQDLIASTVADSNGHWSMQPQRALPDGMHHLSVSSIDRDGEMWGPSNAFDFEVQTSRSGMRSVGDAQPDTASQHAGEPLAHAVADTAGTPHGSAMPATPEAGQADVSPATHTVPSSLAGVLFKAPELLFPDPELAGSRIEGGQASHADSSDGTPATFADTAMPLVPVVSDHADTAGWLALQNLMTHTG